jgi:hypothetical protein
MSVHRAFLIDPTLPLGLIANTAAILAMTLGREKPEFIGPPVVDGDGTSHPGITTVVLPMLAAEAAAIAEIRAKAVALGHPDLGVIDVTETAQRAKTYEEYTSRIASRTAAEIRYFGLCLHGPAKVVKSLTGSLSLLRHM